MRYAGENGLNLHKIRGFMDCHARIFALARNDDAFCHFERSDQATCKA